MATKAALILREIESKVTFMGFIEHLLVLSLSSIGYLLLYVSEHSDICR